MGKECAPLFAYFHTQQEDIKNDKCMTLGIVWNTSIWFQLIP